MSLRSKLTIGSVVVVLATNVALALVVIHSVENLYLAEVQSRVRLDLNAARAIYDHEINDITRLLQAVSLRRPITRTLAEESRGDLGRVLRALWREGELDVLALLDPDGRVVYRAHNPAKRGDDLSNIPVVARALAERTAVEGTFLVPRVLLREDGEALAERAGIEVAEPPDTHTGTVGVLGAGMAIGAAVPFASLDRTGPVRGVLYGAKLLNQRSTLADRIKEIEYQNRSYEGKDVGVATVFQGDVRIATSVRTDGGDRRVGTHLSPQVRERVLVSGRVWADRARVVDDWYFTAYEPIRDPDGRIIGALGLALLEAPFTHPQRAHLAYFVIAVAATSIGTVILLVLMMRVATRPIDRIVAMSQRVIDGDLTARVGIHAPAEMGIVCAAIDHMADAVAEREEQLKEATQRQISQSDRLASVGRLAAGIAHEINNPLTGVLMFAHLLQEKEGRDQEDTEDLDLIVSETERVRDIVRSLLDFARQTAPRKELLDINSVVRDTLKLAKKQAERGKVVIHETLGDGLPPVLGDRNQLEQVLLNLSLNAIEAMPDGGRLSLSTEGRSDHVVVLVRDTGCGIKAENLDRVFDPFFTTKPAGEGTGLGLSVSHGIIQAHGGDLAVESRQGEGTTMTVVLPVHEGDTRPAGPA